MLVDAIFIVLFLLTWSVLGTLAWIALSLRRRAVGALFALPIALVGAMGGGAATPLLGLNDGAGIGVSMITALLGGALLGQLAFAAWDLLELGRLLQPLARRKYCAERDGSIESQSEQHICRNQRPCG